MARRMRRDRRPRLADTAVEGISGAQLPSR